MEVKCCIHDDNVKEKQLIKISGLEPWKTLFEAAKVRKDTDLLKIAEPSTEATFSELLRRYLDNTLRRYLEKLQTSPKNYKTILIQQILQTSGIIEI